MAGSPPVKELSNTELELEACRALLNRVFPASVWPTVLQRTRQEIAAARAGSGSARAQLGSPAAPSRAHDGRSASADAINRRTPASTPARRDAVLDGPLACGNLPPAHGAGTHAAASGGAAASRQQQQWQEQQRCVPSGWDLEFHTPQQEQEFAAWYNAQLGRSDAWGSLLHVLLYTLIYCSVLSGLLNARVSEHRGGPGCHVAAVAPLLALPCLLTAFAPAWYARFRERGAAVFQLCCIALFLVQQIPSLLPEPSVGHGGHAGGSLLLLSWLQALRLLAAAGVLPLLCPALGPRMRFSRQLPLQLLVLCACLAVTALRYAGGAPATKEDAAAVEASAVHALGTDGGPGGLLQAAHLLPPLLLPLLDVRMCLLLQLCAATAALLASRAAERAMRTEFARRQTRMGWAGAGLGEGSG